MGSWGTAIFLDDLAADIRDEFTDLIGEGLTSEEATKRILEEHRNSTSDEDELGVLTLALAATQWQLGRLLEAVKEQALRIIDSGEDLKRWDEPSLARSRQRHLLKLKNQLLSTQPPPKKVRRRKKSSTSFRPGDIVRYSLDETCAVLFCVAHVWGDRGGTYAEIRLLCLDEGRRFDPSTFGLDLARPDRDDEVHRNFVMVDHEPADRAEIVMRDVALPDWRSPNLRSLLGRGIGGIGCKWSELDQHVREAMRGLGWNSGRRRN